MKRILAFLFLAFFVSVLDCGKLRAQDTAQISGTVKDQSGAVLPGAEITATQTETGSMRTSISNETGSDVLPKLPPGPYRVEGPLPGFSIAGGFLGGNTYTLDGAFHNDVYANYGLPLPFPDALQEFKVETSSLPAQYGFHSGGAINAVTKSGTNDWHGSLFEFVRNYKFNARDFFANTRDGLKRNQYGGTIGGPIRKNKLFLFGG